MTERQLQQSIVEYLDLNENPAVFDYFHVPSTFSNPRFGKLMKSMGAKAGVSDLVFDIRGRIVYVEIKHKGYLTQVQKGWREWAQKRGATYFLVRSVAEMEVVLETNNVPIKARAVT